MPNVDALVASAAGGALLAEFDRAEQAWIALRLLEGSGYGRLELCSPIPITEEDGQKPAPRLGMGLVVAGAGMIGALAGYLVQWYVNVYSYALNVAGRPVH